jgi:hypothetical protein
MVRGRRDGIDSDGFGEERQPTPNGFALPVHNNSATKVEYRQLGT